MTHASAILPPRDSSRTQSTMSVRVGQRRGKVGAGRVTGSARECTTALPISKFDRAIEFEAVTWAFRPDEKRGAFMRLGSSPGVSWPLSETLRARE